VAHLRLEPAGPAEADEQTLVRRAVAGSDEAREALLRRHLDDVYAVTFRILGDADLAADAAQEAFINALRGLHRFRGEASFRTWLLRIAANAARSTGRRRQRRREVPMDAVPEPAAEQPDAAERTANRAEAERIRVLLATLPTKQRMAVTLRVDQGLDYREIGRLIGSSEGAARVNYHLGVKRLRELLQ
jgi:RNA polymerase sigma-70 factor (ECF subfamily)